MSAHSLIVRDLGRRDYQGVWNDMRAFTDQRNDNTTDELWLVEHPPVYTLGYNGKPEHVLNPGEIPVIHVDRGGQVTYHGPGQLVAYTLLDLRRLGLGVRALVNALEETVIALLEDYGINAASRRDAPGVYVNEKKIAALGLRVRRGCSYHGLSLNIATDLEPFRRINPCGYAGMEVTQLRDLGVPAGMQEISSRFVSHFCRRLAYTIQ